MLDLNTLQFLKELDQNNNKLWFQENKKWYEQSRSDFINFSSEILEELKVIQDDLLHTDIKKCILRINRDIRFTKDKRPYKRYFGAGFGPGGKSSGRADFYFQIQPNGKSMIGGGMWEPSSENLAKFRQEIDYNPQILKSIIENESFRAYFNEIEGAKLKTKPRGYEIDHPDIELLRFKELFFLRRFSDKEVFKPNFKNELLRGCIILKPYLDYINQLFLMKPKLFLLKSYNPFQTI